MKVAYLWPTLLGLPGFLPASEVWVELHLHPKVEDLRPEHPVRGRLGSTSEVREAELLLVACARAWPESGACAAAALPLPPPEPYARALAALAQQGASLRAVGEDTGDLVRRFLPHELHDRVDGLGGGYFSVPTILAILHRPLLVPAENPYESFRGGDLEMVMEWEKGKVTVLAAGRELPEVIGQLSAVQGPLLLKVFYAVLDLAREDRLEKGGFWWHPDRVLLREGLRLSAANRRAREERLRWLTQLRHSASLSSGLSIYGSLISPSPGGEVRSIVDRGERIRRARLLQLNPDLAEELTAPKNYMLLDRRWYRLQENRHPQAVALYPLYVQQWRLNARKVVCRGERWLGWSLRSVAKNAGLSLDLANKGRTLARLRKDHNRLMELGLIGGYQVEERDGFIENIWEVWPPEGQPMVEGMREILQGKCAA